MKRILIIDDDPDIVASMKVILENKGYDIDLASSGAEGLDKVKQGKPDLIILDVMMETTSKGFDVSRELKSSEEYKHIPILMLTAIKGETGLDFKKEAGDENWLPVEDFCDKPLDPETLIQKVENLLQKG